MSGKNEAGTFLNDEYVPHTNPFLCTVQRTKKCKKNTDDENHDIANMVEKAILDGEDEEIDNKEEEIFSENE